MGDLHIFDDIGGTPQALGQILCAADVVVEKAKRGATIPGLASWGSVAMRIHHLRR